MPITRPRKRRSRRTPEVDTALDLSDAYLRKYEFVAMLGHELRNPLSAVAHGLELLGRTAHDRPRSEKLRLMMIRQTGRIGALLDQLLDIAWVSSGKVAVSRLRVDLAVVLRAAVETVEPLVDSLKHDLVVDLPREGSAFVRGDAGRLTQVFENLLTNAAANTGEGGRISLAVTIDESTVRVMVKDTGIGMSAELLPHIFEVFTQAPRPLDRGKGGLGLGLPLVRRLVELHLGKVLAASPGLGQGSEFTVTLPRLGPPLSKAPAAAAEAPKARPAVHSRRILVVDDEVDLAETLVDLLEDDGHQALVARNGPVALAAVRTFIPDVVLLDLGLPGMDGYEVARRMRKEPGGKRLLLIAVTGYRSDGAQLNDAGFDGHLIKPPDMDKLAALLARKVSGGKKAI